MSDVHVKDDRDDMIESIVDSVGVRATLESLSDIARMKAEHLYSHWQDDKAGAYYEKLARSLERLAIQFKDI